MTSTRGFGVGPSVIRVDNLAISTSDVPQFQERSATGDGLQLIKGEFGLVIGVRLSRDTPFPDSAFDSMSCLVQSGDIAHGVSRASHQIHHTFTGRWSGGVQAINR
jgi:hypothetical protein